MIAEIAAPAVLHACEGIVLNSGLQEFSLADRVKNFADIMGVCPVLGDRRRFIKNGTFSDKFSFEKCIVQDDTLAFSFININYGALVLDAGGLSELALRRVIPSDSRFTPRIYGGLPLRTEIRCFYDFDQQKLMGSVNWDYEYVFPQLRSKTDIIIFSHERERMERDFETWLPRVEEAAKRHLPQADLKGQWSVDFLVDEGGYIWLIDMALARQSAYFRKN